MNSMMRCQSKQEANAEDIHSTITRTSGPPVEPQGTLFGTAGNPCLYLRMVCFGHRDRTLTIVDRLAHTLVVSIRALAWMMARHYFGQ